MKLDDLRPAPGARTRRKRVGRGPGSGHGKTSGKGHKGHKARSGGGKTGGFEGGQMPLYRRLPKRGFLPHGGKDPYAIVNLRSLGGFAADAVVDPDALVAAGLVKRRDRERVKILGAGDLPHALTVKVHAISESARAKVVERGGRVELLAHAVVAS
ncbi:MAG TPA: 50S ribosomal protein L15 [Methylomirabilota bacterium]|nr:50S ribosomal protein L15 [Methylomirabilota bacterium]